MDGVHLEAYVCETEDPGLCEAIVALHCERGCPGRRQGISHHGARAKNPVRS